MIGGRPASSRSRRRVPPGVVVALLALAALSVVVLIGVAGYFDKDPISQFPAVGARSPVGALYVSGDMGLRFGMGPSTAAALAQHGIAVVGVSAPAVFGTHRSRDAVDRVVADAVRQGLARTQAHRLVLIGQSFGADILQTGLAALPTDLRSRIAAVVLVVPGRTVFFRADPSGFAYRGVPDSIAPATARTIDWVPLTCIYGRAEPDSLCPHLDRANQRVVAMPGGHFLNRDSSAVTAQVLAAIDRAVPGAVGPTH